MIRLKPFVWQRIILEIQPEDIITLPGSQRGLFFRDMLEKGLKGFTCVYKGGCIKCPIKGRCGYHILFDRSMGIERKKRPPAALGFIIEYPSPPPQVFTNNTKLEISFTLVGQLNQSLPFLIEILNNLGQIGIGPGHDKFIVTSMKFEDPFGGERCSITPPYDISLSRRLLITSKNIQTYLNHFYPEKIRIRFLQPLLFPKKPEKIDLYGLIQRLKDRLILLSKTFCTESISIDHFLLKETIRNTLILDHDLRWGVLRDIPPRKMHWSFLNGWIELGGNFRSLLPLLLLGQFIHFGKLSAYGYGTYRIEAL